MGDLLLGFGIGEGDRVLDEALHAREPTGDGNGGEGDVMLPEGADIALSNELSRESPSSLRLLRDTPEGVIAW